MRPGTSDPRALCLGLAAASAALRRAMERGDVALLLAREADLRALAEELLAPDGWGPLRKATGDALSEALDAVRAAQVWLERQGAEAEAAAHRTHRLRQAYGRAGA
ncbi:hypothetical protein D1122_18190 [Cereibacter sphaeroides]|uniref:hypothetical protein n=1 Tax=Cereibacter sphaeroides TaxID=1063 RepID=UPI000E5A7674|nr:hypothetical protein [Cereibacter sphaeroides]RHZ93345.1 hypothetical protein D1122_18190 [Cereibacter sphaeroides]